MLGGGGGGWSLDGLTEYPTSCRGQPELIQVNAIQGHIQVAHFCPLLASGAGRRGGWYMHSWHLGMT